MNIEMFEVILYVKHQQTSTDFYSKVLGSEPTLNVPGMTEFTIAENLKLGLMPEDSIAKIITPKTPHPSTASGTPRCELYIYTDNIEDKFKRAIAAGAKEISGIEKRGWGDNAGYLADPDGHIIAFAEKAELAAEGKGY